MKGSISFSDFDVFVSFAGLLAELMPWTDAMPPTFIKGVEVIIDMILKRKELADWGGKLVTEMFDQWATGVVDQNLISLIQIAADEAHIDNYQAFHQCVTAGIGQIRMYYSMADLAGTMKMNS